MYVRVRVNVSMYVCTMAQLYNQRALQHCSMLYVCTLDDLWLCSSFFWLTVCAVLDHAHSESISVEKKACKRIMERHVFFFQSALQHLCLHDPYVQAT